MAEEAGEGSGPAISRRRYVRRLSNARARRHLSSWRSMVAVPAVVILVMGLVIQALRRDWSWWTVFGTLLVFQFVVTLLTPGRFTLTIDEAGVTDRRLLRQRHFPIDDVVALSWDLTRRPGSPFVTGPGLVVLVRHDPWPKNLHAGACRKAAEAHRMLAEIAEHGWPTDDREEPASVWWYLRPEARRLDRHPSRPS